MLRRALDLLILREDWRAGTGGCFFGLTERLKTKLEAESRRRERA